MSTKRTCTHICTCTHLTYFMSLVLYAWSHIYLYFHFRFLLLSFQISRLDFVSYTHIYIWVLLARVFGALILHQLSKFQLLPLKIGILFSYIGFLCA